MDIADVGTPRLTWGKLRRLLDEIPQTSSSALAWRLAEDQGRYPIDLEVQVATLDAARTAIWMQSKDASKGRGRPKPTPRPNNGKTRSQLERIEERARRFRDRHRG